MTTRPGSQESDVVLRDGSTVHVCPAKPADAPAVRLLLKGLSDRSRWLRFFSAFPNLAKAARWATEVDDGRRYGLVATTQRDGRMVGHAGLERGSDRPERAEVALEIADAMQGKGLGTALLCRLAEAAYELGIQVLDAEVLPENRQMIQVFRGCGYSVKVHSFPRGGAGRTANLPGRNGPEAAGAAQPDGMTGTWAPAGESACIPRQAAGPSQGQISGVAASGF